jgi:hypothetical protein
MIPKISFAGNQQNLGEGEGWDAPFYKCATLTGLLTCNVYDDLLKLVGVVWMPFFYKYAFRQPSMVIGAVGIEANPLQG